MAAEDSQSDYEDVLSFWFGTLDASGQADAEHTRRWFTKDPAFDETIRQRFESLHQAVADNERDHWLLSPRGRLAYIIVLDQFSRNMFRETPRMFAHDGQALRAAIEGIDRGIESELAASERMFFIMPLMHSEDLASQNRCVEIFAAWRDAAAEDQRQRVAGNLKYAEQHRDIVKRFGRFPHRNALLGRMSTAEERDFLAQPGSSF